MYLGSFVHLWKWEILFKVLNGSRCGSVKTQSVWSQEVWFQVTSQSSPSYSIYFKESAVLTGDSFFPLFFSTKSTDRWNSPKVNSWPLSVWIWSMKSCSVSQQSLELSRLQGRLMVSGIWENMHHTCLSCFYLCLLDESTQGNKRIMSNTLKIKDGWRMCSKSFSALLCKTALEGLQNESHATDFVCCNDANVFECYFSEKLGLFQWGHNSASDFPHNSVDLQAIFCILVEACRGKFL